MGVETLLKVVFAILIAAALVVALLALNGVIAEPASEAVHAVGYLSDTEPGWGVYGHMWRDQEYIEGSGGPDLSFGPGKALGDVMSLFVPKLVPDGQVFSTLGNFVYDPAVNSGWLWVILGGLPVAIAGWLGVKYLARYLLGGG